MSEAHLFSALEMRGVTVHNRVWVSPMCQYSVMKEDGVATEWHFVHYGSRAVGGAGLVMVEATAVEARGRITARDLGLWNDAQAQGLAPIARFMADQGAVPGVQIAHAGRKARVPGAVGPSAIAFSASTTAPEDLGPDEMARIVAAFGDAARRAAGAGFQALEIHAAHGYLLHEFLSPISNRRTDDYGGVFEGRIRLPLEIVRSVRAAWPERWPLLVRVSATDWIDGGWDMEQSVAFARRLRDEGVDLVDCSSGGLSPDQKIQVGPGYQVPFSERIRREAGIATAAVGLITSPQRAEQIVAQGRADVVFIGRQSLRDPYWPLRAARELGQLVEAPSQYSRAW